jgi:hypothetical protein
MRAHEFILEEYDQEYKEKLKSLVDQRKTSNEIADILGIPLETVRSHIKRFYPERELAWQKVTPAQITQLKNLWDEGWSREDIAELMGLKVRRIDNLLSAYYPDRPRKQVHRLDITRTPEMTRQMVDMFNAGENLSKIAMKFGVDKTTPEHWIDDAMGKGYVAGVLDDRRKLPGTSTLPNKITPEMLNTMRYLYKQGTSLQDISDKLGNVIVGRTVLATMVKQPDYAQLRAEWEKNRQRVKPKLSADRKIYRPGTIDNLRSKGPGSKHMYGVFTPKKI